MTAPNLEGKLHWRVYQRIAAALSDELEGGIDVSITPNAKIMGAITERKRQIDVLVDARWGDDDVSHRIIVDAKHRRAKVDVNDVESFEGMMKDCRANRGILVCSSGYTETAKRRAQDDIAITVLSIDEAMEFSWTAFDECLGGCLSRSPAQRGLAFWDGQHAVGLGARGAIIWTGKCDGCHQFHVWCQDCGEKFALGDEATHTCGCDSREWVTAIEADPATGECDQAVHLFVCSEGQVLSLDRRRLR